MSRELGSHLSQTTLHPIRKTDLQLASQPRQYHFDSIRGIAAISVVMIHYFAAFYPYAIFGNRENYLQREGWESIFSVPPFGLLVAGHASVWLFFILSGYVLSYGYLGISPDAKKLISAILKRPIRLGGIVIFTVILSAILWASHLYANNPVAALSHSNPWFTDFWAGEITMHQVFLGILTSMFKNGELYNPSLWTIRTELYGSILIFCLMLIMGNFKYRLPSFIVITLALFFKGRVLSYCSGLMIGVVVADLIKHHHLVIKLQAKSIYSWVLFVAFVFFASYPHYSDYQSLQGTIYGFLPPDSEMGVYPLIGAFSLFLLIMINDRLKDFLQHPVFQFLGKISYALYAIHFLVLGSVSSWIFLWLTPHLPYGLCFLLVLLMSAPIIIFASIWMTKYVDEPSIQAATYVSQRAIALRERSGRRAR